LSGPDLTNGAIEASPSADGVRVVIAEDEAIIRLDLKEILVSSGFEVVGETGRGDEAVLLVEEHDPDLVILDIKMPGLDGLEAARQITMRPRSQVAVMLLTAFSQRDLIEEARDAGVAAYLVKPFRRDQILPAIENVLLKCRQDWAIEDEIAGLGVSDEASENKIETRRLVDQAKAILMDRGSMNEADAFEFIQKTAMQSRTQMRHIALRVIDGSLAP